MTKESIPLTKDDKWMLASHLQKAIRRGLAEEAAWAAGHLHSLDRAYLAYRMSVICVEDTAAGDLATTASLLGETPWGAKRFGTKRDEVERQAWEEAARTLARQRKDRTPCDWMACRAWLSEFESQEGPWAQLDPIESIDQALNEKLVWWKRGLFAWRAAGTDRFPDDALPVVKGEWEDWVAAVPDADLQTVMMGFGARQREAHPVFLPLAVAARKSDANAKQALYIDPNHKVVKNGVWLSAAIDGHTRPGMAAIHHFVRQLPPSALHELSGMKATPVAMTRKLMFWMEGGHINEGWDYQIKNTILLDSKKKWLERIGGGNGHTIVKHLGKPEMWYKSRQFVIDRASSENSPMSRNFKM